MALLKMENTEEVKQVNQVPAPKKAKKTRNRDGFYSGGSYYRDFEAFVKESVHIAMENDTY